MLQVELVTVPDLGLQLCRLWFSRIERLLNDLVHQVISENFHHRSVDRGLRQREHPLQSIVHQSDAHLAIRDQNTLDHASKNSPETEILVRDVARHLSLSARNLFQIPVNLQDDPG